jgi:hypothetical protein
MAPIEDRIRVSARISKELDARIRQHYASLAQAINEALELLVKIKEGKFTPVGTNDARSDSSHKSTEAHNFSFGATGYTDGNDDDANGSSELKSRLSDALAQVEFLKGQIAIKDNQIAIKDQQIDKQAFSLQSVIQENSRLNIKLLPENAEKSKPWWRFW